jgi:GH15 family glucan-1,4-alpha-glucosidase
MMPPRGYLPISDYGAIGNLRTAALIGLDGSIDWCCLPELDDASIFAALLDARRGGRFQVTLPSVPRGEQRYVPRTNVLETSFRNERGELVITDFMPLAGDIDGQGDSHAEPELHRHLAVTGEDVDVDVYWEPRPDYARQSVTFHEGSDMWVAEAGEAKVALFGLRPGEARVVAAENGPALYATLRMRSGEPRALVTRWGDERVAHGVDRTAALLEETVQLWRSWVRTGRDRGTDGWSGAYAEQVARSELALKLVTHADTGAIAAAATTSLPEEIGGVRNWDYRYTWIRDSSLTAQALVSLGHSREANEFLLFTEHAAEAAQRDDWALQIMYGLHGETELEEIELPHLEGYRRSSPVRVGNGAAKQLQLDVYGELLASAYELARRQVHLEPSLRRFLAGVAERAADRWREPDFGIWEVRSEPRHFVYSKVMVWVALDRAVHLAEMGVIEGNVAHWKEQRERVRADVLAHGYDAERRCFTQAYGEPAIDAANLLMPIYEFVAFDDPRVQGTIDCVLAELTENDLVYRYHADDGLPGGEGAFGLCTFWLVDNLALSGRLDEAWRIYDGICRRANHVGLFAEQIDAANGEFLGNFPQAFTHIGLINSTLYLAHAEGRSVPEPALIGTDAHRRIAGHGPSAHGR